jgi:hypothetical protein
MPDAPTETIHLGTCPTCQTYHGSWESCPRPSPAALGALTQRLTTLANNLVACDCYGGRCIVAAAKAINPDELHRAVDLLRGGGEDTRLLDFCESHVCAVTTRDSDGEEYDHECPSRVDVSFRKFLSELDVERAARSAAHPEEAR